MTRRGDRTLAAYDAHMAEADRERALVDAFEDLTTRQKADLMVNYPDLYLAVAKWTARSRYAR